MAFVDKDEQVGLRLKMIDVPRESKKQVTIHVDKIRQMLTDFRNFTPSDSTINVQ